jgi:8-oxo-dGTP diphosphatase
MIHVNFYDEGFIPEGRLTYSVIAAIYKGKWLVVRHNQRTTWEIPGGHIEEGESSDEAASRELVEETGAVEFSIQCVASYSVEKDGKTGYGRLYKAEVRSIGKIPDISEIAEVKTVDILPDNLTYPDIQPLLLERVKVYLKEEENLNC